MKKSRIPVFIMTLMMLLSLSFQAYAMTDAEWVWYSLREYSGQNGKNGCQLVKNKDFTYFGASQISLDTPNRLRVDLIIDEYGDQAFIQLYANIEKANLGTVQSDYLIDSIEFDIDGTVYEWHDLINNTSDHLFYTTTPGVIMLVPEKIFYSKMKNADKVTITAQTCHNGSYQTFSINDEDNCANLREFSRLVIDCNIWDHCAVGIMNAVTQEYPMRTTTASVSYSYGQRLRVINCNSSISLRMAPDPDANRVCMIPLGTSVTYLSNAENGFYLIEWDGTKGYASSLYLG